MANEKVQQLRPEGHFALEAELADRVQRLVYEYDGRISMVSAIGVLELVKANLLPKA
jgi:hypothetical protein